MGTKAQRLLSPFTWLLIYTGPTLFVFCANDLAAVSSIIDPEEKKAPCLVSVDVEVHDVREGEDLTLLCRYNPKASVAKFGHYWTRDTAKGHDNVAIGSLPLEDNYGLENVPEEGYFDLIIHNVTYRRDHGEFECRAKSRTGQCLHSQIHYVTVLSPPRPPVLNTGPHVQTQESRELNITCSTSGGSPEPTIKWYREGSTYPLDAVVKHGRTRSTPSVATLTLRPTPEDNGAILRCVVWNRAMPEGQQLDTSVDLSVDYYPRVEIGPENPLRVEIGGTATMQCKVDAKPKVNTVRWTRDGKYISNSYSHTIQTVTVQDAGKYTCSADNGLGSPGEKELYLDVLFPPVVSIESKTYETEEGGNVEIRCDVSANPEPISVEWTMEGKPEFRQNGDTLQLSRVSAEMVGTYACRAVNVITSSNGKRVERSNSALVAVLVRHKPGRAVISPERPVVHEGMAVTLTCSAKPPGWPAPQYRWFYNLDETNIEPTVIGTGNKHTIPSANLGSEGTYHCQATNELGHGEIAAATLEVQQPPHFQSKLQNQVTKRAGDRDYSVTCSALGKPRPEVKWFKNSVEIKPDSDLYEIKNDITEGRKSVFNVQSTLRFFGKSRSDVSNLLPDDKGVYTCMFENEVRKLDSTMRLRIEHEPILIRQQTKVAYDVMENAEISCRVQAFPKPEFEWFFGNDNTPLEKSTDGHYDVSTTTDNNDSYLSVLKIKTIRNQDYGDYYCRVTNSLNSIRPQIRLQPKGAPESPQILESKKIGSSYVTLQWEPGFNGGLSSTKYFVRYRRVLVHGAVHISEHCSSDRVMEQEWLEYDCGRENPCNVTRLDQHNTYVFKVKAVNPKGHSNYSNEISVVTKVDSIAEPKQVTYDPATRTMVFTVGPTCLALVGVAEGLTNMAGTSGWQVVDTIPLRLSGAVATVQEATMDIPNPLAHSANRLTAGPPPPHDDKPVIRLKLCLQMNQDICSEYADAKIGQSYIKDASALNVTKVAILAVCFVVVLCLGAALVYFCCKQKAKVKRSKDYEMDSRMPSMVKTPENQAPPPYYPSTGMENKALEHSMDLGLTIDDSKNTMYATQGGYAYHVSPHGQPPHPGQTMPNPDWASMGYAIENSYTNSNNGGSVDSQDSLWQMKMAAAGNSGAIPSHQIVDRQSNYEYDPINHGGYRALDDYAPYAHLPHASHPPPSEYNMRTTPNPSRQEYCSDPYASVHKPKKRMDQHIESPYHEVSGLPEYGGAGEEASPDEKPPHLSLSYDESLESGYSTPNSRSRRVIREIIV